MTKILKTIYLIRHGETDFNRLGIVQGSGVDADLNDLGRAQAKAFFEQHQDVAFDKIYTSALRRTWQSVEGFIEKGIHWEKHEGLNEISWGIKEGKRITPSEDRTYYHLLKNWKNGLIHEKIEAGESPVEVQQRQVKALEYILSKPEEETILICMHGRAMRVLLCHLQGLDLKLMDQFPHQNLGLYKILQMETHFHIAVRNLGVELVFPDS